MQYTIVQGRAVRPSQEGQSVSVTDAEALLTVNISGYLLFANCDSSPSETPVSSDVFSMSRSLVNFSYWRMRKGGGGDMTGVVEEEWVKVMQEMDREQKEHLEEYLLVLVDRAAERAPPGGRRPSGPGGGSGGGQREKLIPCRVS